MDNCLERLDLSLHTSPDTDRCVWHFNVAFIGSCRAGKTKLLQRFVDSQFSDIYSQTTETSFVSKSANIGRHHVVFQCWDTPGSARSGCLDPRLDQLHAVFIVFDASRDAIADLEHWHHLSTTAAAAKPDGVANSPLLVIVANKTDLGCHEESMTRARDLCRARRGLAFTLSVLSDEENLEVDAMMLEVGKALTERHAREIASAVSAAAAASNAAIPTPVMPQFAGDVVEAPQPSVLQSPAAASLQWALQTSLTVEQQPMAAPAQVDCDLAEGDATPCSPASKFLKTEALGGGSSEEDGSQREGRKGWWARAACCCNCW